MRRAIADHLTRTQREVPAAWTMQEVDMTRLVRWRQATKEEFRAREGVDLTYLPFVVQATAETLREQPILNSRWENDQVTMLDDINVGIAIALDGGLIVPVIRNADRLGIPGLARVISDLADRARRGALRIEDVQGGTFTVNNTGAFGSVLSVPLVNSPQAAILSMEAIVKRPVVVDDDAIAVRSMMNLCISFDHRVLDGAVAGRFVGTVKRHLEAYGPGGAL